MVVFSVFYLFQKIKQNLKDHLTVCMSVCLSPFLYIPNPIFFLFYPCHTKGKQAISSPQNFLLSRMNCWSLKVDDDIYSDFAVEENIVCMSSLLAE
jgi:hypothetical protein